jgi:hypothetical protein
MESNPPQQGKPSRSRRDLASRLLLPHLFFIRDLRARTRDSERADTFPGADLPSVSFKPAVDVICCGMYRACSTWQYEVAAHLVERHLGGKRLGYVTAAQYKDMLERDARVHPDRARAPRVLKSHEGDRVFARRLAEGRAVGVYAYRDVRDVAFSLMHKRKMNFQQLLRSGMIHQVVANDRFWSRCRDVLVQRYDDLVQFPADGVLAIARHLGLDLGLAEAEMIAREYSQDSNRARTAALRHRLHEAGIDLDRVDNAQICDATTLLHWNHMRDSSASWRSQATAHEAAVLNRVCRRWLCEHGYELEAGSGAGWWSSFRGAGKRLFLQGEIDLVVGRLNYVVRNASLRFPGFANRLKRMLGIATDQPAGATAWGDNEGRRAGLTHESAAAEAESTARPR